MNNLFYIKDFKSLTKTAKDNYGVVFDNKKTIISYYKDDIWDFRSYYVDNHNGSSKKINYNTYLFNDKSPITNNNSLIYSFKDINYVYFCQGVKFKSLHNFSDHIFIFYQYINDCLNLKSVSAVTEEHLIAYCNYIKATYRDHSISYVKGILNAINKFWKYKDYLSDTLSFNPIIIIQSIQQSPVLKQTQQTDIIPDHEWQQIVNLCSDKITQFLNNQSIELKIIEDCNSYHINKNIISNHFSERYAREFYKYGSIYKNASIHNEYLRDVVISSAILIQSFTGMRISELLSLKTNCLIEEEVFINGNKEIILKIKGKTFKYKEDSMYSNGEEAVWLCPPIVHKAINALTIISSQKRTIYENMISNNEGDIEYLRNFKDFLFIAPKYGRAKRINIMKEIGRFYLPFLEKNGISLNIELKTHCFRRTFARFFAKCLIKIPIEALKEQFKHYSNHITYYYTKESNNIDPELVDLIENYITSNNDKDLLLFEKIKEGFSKSILAVNNIEELLEITDGKQFSIANKYMISIKSGSKQISALDCLTCDGTIILPDLHIDFWKEMLVMYNEIYSLEPNNSWYLEEYESVKKLVEHLEQGNAYIVKENKQ